MDQKYVWNTPWILQRADPYVCRGEKGEYYFAASLPEYDGIAIRCADTVWDLKDAPERRIWNAHESGIMSFHVWAPELHFVYGKWYCYFAAGDKDDVWEIRPYVLECQGDDPMTDDWIEKGPMQPADGDRFSFNDFSLDGTVFEVKGENYFVWAEKVNIGKKISNLYIAKMASPWKLATAQVLLTSPDYDWERVGFWVNEGPYVLQRNGKIYLTYSASETGICYCVGMLSVDENADLLDPRVWKKERYPVLESDPARGVYGPGHNCFVVDEQGRDLMVYHARTEEAIEGNPLYNPNRHAFLMPLMYDEEGRPVFSYDAKG